MFLQAIGEIGYYEEVLSNPTHNILEKDGVFKKSYLHPSPKGTYFGTPYIWCFMPTTLNKNNNG